MEQEKENGDQPDASERTAELLNGDIGDGNAGQDDEGSAPQAHWTGTESHTGNEDGVGTNKSEGVADHKVTCFSAAELKSSCCIFRTCHECCLAALQRCTYTCVCVFVCVCWTPL